MNYIYTYYQQIKDGSVVVGRWIKLWYEIVVKKIESKEYTYDAKAAAHAINFIENYCRHHEGALAPNRVTLEVWQKAIKVAEECNDYSEET